MQKKISALNSKYVDLWIKYTHQYNEKCIFSLIFDPPVVNYLLSHWNMHSYCTNFANFCAYRLADKYFLRPSIEYVHPCLAFFGPLPCVAYPPSWHILGPFNLSPPCSCLRTEGIASLLNKNPLINFISFCSSSMKKASLKLLHCCTLATSLISICEESTTAARIWRIRDEIKCTMIVQMRP